MKDDLVIIRVDGGICSQISFLCLGLAFEKKGYKVKYDLTWFEKYGEAAFNTKNGYDSSYNVTFDIPKLFTDIKYQIASEEEINRYKKKFFVDDENIIDRTPPLYGGGFLGRNKEAQFRNFLIERLNPQLELNQKAKKCLEEMKNSLSCAIHVRRGDLSNYNRHYGYPSSIEYFLKAVKLAQSLHSTPVKFYIFSDDLLYVKTHLLSKIENCTLCDFHTPQEGFLDLFLMLNTKILIGSQGSFGSYAKWLNPKALFITPIYNKLLFENDDDCILLSCGIQGGAKKEDNINLKYKIRLKIYQYLRNKLLRKGFIQ